MDIQNTSINIWLTALAVGGLSATTVMVQPVQTAEIHSPVVSTGFHDFDWSIKILRSYLNSVNSSEAEVIKLAQASGGADELLLDPSCDDPLIDKSDCELLEITEGSPGDDSDGLLVDDENLIDEVDTLTGEALLQEDDKGDDVLDSDDDDSLLTTDDAANESEEQTDEEAQIAQQRTADAEHKKLFVESRYPSANTCAACHTKQYEEWSVSQHAYAQLSPVYMAMQTTINIKTSQTNGDFCIRCHNPVGMNLGESLFISNLDRAPTSREGITCVACHRVNKNYGKISGRFSLVEGDVFSPVYGPTGGNELKRVLSKPEEYRVSTSKDDRGRSIHTEAEQFFALTKPGFCGACHDVTLLNGFRLEEAFAEYKRSPAARRGETCQDCHMGKIQGVASGYDYGPAATIGDVPTKDRKLTNHIFAGPDYSIIHPGIFPHNVEAAEFKTLAEWLQFDYVAGWGTDQFEDNVSEDHAFPEAWESIDDRYDSRDILDEQFEKLAWAREQRLEVLQNGFHLGDITVDEANDDGIRFAVEVKNATDGHGVPTGFDAERVIFLQVTVTDSRGTVIYRSGDRDPNGDVRDAHSLYVHNGELPLDKDLFNLQSKFLVRMLRGGEREQVLPVNKSFSVLSFVRPETRATVLYGRPRLARKHKQTIEPLGRRLAQYSVKGDKLTGNGPYQVNVKLIAQMVPVNLIHAIQGVGFDFGMSPKGIADAVVEGAHVVWVRDTTIDLHAGGGKAAMQ